MMYDIGVIGLAVMGSNLALNMADKGFNVAAYDFMADYTKEFQASCQRDDLGFFDDLPTFLDSLERPRRVFMMIKAGEPVDKVIGQLLPLLDEGDIVMDGGNSFFEDTRRRSNQLQAKGIHYFGIGVSGGEKGARFGPALMPGGNAQAYKSIQPILEAIAAKAGDDPCCTYIGPDGAGHYVKMVHNGIEYADMELITEAYRLLKYVGKYSNEELAQIFHQWNQGELKSYLIGITADIFAEPAEGGQTLVDLIVDSAGQKGTGRWASIQSLQQGVDTSMITAACNVRVLSNQSDSRRKAASCIDCPAKETAVPDGFIEQVRQSLYVAKIVAYAQGFALYQSASKEYGWHLDFARIAAIFRGGCIIQAEFLNKITEAYMREPSLDNLMFDQFFLDKINEGQQFLRDTACLAIQQGIAVPAFANALQYIDAYRCGAIGANLIQAQRDYFGAHTFKRIDVDGVFHHEWSQHFSY